MLPIAPIFVLTDLVDHITCITKQSKLLNTVKKTANLQSSYRSLAISKSGQVISGLRLKQKETQNRRQSCGHEMQSRGRSKTAAFF